MKKVIKKVFLICIIIIACFAYAHIDKLTYIYDKEIDTSEFVNTGIIEDTTITQTFISNEDSLDGVQTKCTVAGKVDNVQIEYELKEADSGKTVSKGSTAGSEIKNNKFNKFRFDKINNCKGKQYQIIFKETGSDDLNGISFYISSKQECNQMLTVKGNNTQGTMIVRTICHRFDMETFCVVLFFSAYIIVFLKMLYKLFD